MAVPLLFPLVQHVPELPAPLSLRFSSVHQLVEAGSILRQDHFSQLCEERVLQVIVIIIILIIIIVIIIILIIIIVIIIIIIVIIIILIIITVIIIILVIIIMKI